VPWSPERPGPLSDPDQQRELATYLDACRRAASEFGAPAVVDATALQVACALGRDVALARGADLELPELPEGAAEDLVGHVHEALLDPSHRRRSGSFYTPGAIAAGIVDLLFSGVGGADLRRWTICDPASGGGAFALAAARALHRAGLSRHDVVAERVWAADIDPAAAAVTATALRLWAAAEGPPPEPNVVVVDSLVEPLRAWPTGAPSAFDAVVGNPPFLGQLRADTARDPAHAATLRRLLGAAPGYADTASLFLVASLQLVRERGRVALVLPESVLASRDARRVRAQVLSHARLLHLWFAGEPVFSASVRVCVPVLERRASPGRRASVARSQGPRFEARPVIDVDDLASAPTWGALVASMVGVPALRLGSPEGVLGDLCDVTAGFRQQYYGVIDHVREAEPAEVAGSTWSAHRAPLVTSGTIDPASCTWGRTAVTFARRRWQAPVVDLAALQQAEPAVARWAEARRRPKVVVASQTRIIEAVADPDGQWYPSTPVVSVEPRDRSVWDVLAVLLAPAASVWAATSTVGTALAAAHLRLPASVLRQIPLPVDHQAWAEGAVQARRASGASTEAERTAALDELGRAMGAAYGVGDEVLEWWMVRRVRP
jgi:hypothetical protein